MIRDLEAYLKESENSGIHLNTQVKKVSYEKGDDGKVSIMATDSKSGK